VNNQPLKTHDLSWLMTVIADGIVRAISPLTARIAAVEKSRVLDDVSVEYDGQRSLTLIFKQGDHRKEFKLNLPLVLDRGIFRETAEDVAGDGTTHGGSYWIALRETSGIKPGTNGDWRLAVKRGQDGKDYRPAVSL
jgi:hypothetical protein